MRDHRWEQAARYLGRPDARVEELMRRAFAALDAAAPPRAVWTELPCSTRGEETRLGGAILRSRDLAALLRNCPRALACAVTLGVRADALIARAQVTDLAYALALQACAAATAEEAMNELLRERERQLRPQELYLTPAFSPGYGDLPPQANAPLLDLLRAPQRIGVTMLASGMLAPTKSIAAICGVTAQPCAPQTHKCARCAMTNCPYRKE